MAELKTVLVGTSLDDDSEVLVKVGAEAARAAGARLHLAHAFAPLPMEAGDWRAPMDVEGFLRTEEERLRGALEAQAARVGAAEWSLERGAAHRVLTDLAARLGAGLVVLGATTGGPIARVLGSTVDRVIRRAGAPVLVVRGDLRLPPERVLAPVDLSPLSGQAFRRGLEILRAVGGGAAPEVEALFVLSVLQRQTSPQFTPEQIDRLAAEELERFVAAQGGEGAAAVRRRVRAGNVREEILAGLVELEGDLVLLGTHGMGGFERFVIGSVAADIIREAPCSVLVVPPSEP